MQSSLTDCILCKADGKRENSSRVKAGKSRRELIRKPSILIADKSPVSPSTRTATFHSRVGL